MLGNKRIARTLTRIFHTNLLRRPGSQMDAALDSHFDLDSMYTYSPASKCSSALPHQPSRSPRHDQYEISGLTRLFHTDSAAACEHLMDTASASNCSSGSMKHRAVVVIHHLSCPHQSSQLPHDDHYEISRFYIFV
ncbi:MAG: hypothetical protein K9M81_04730 [Chthoniobacterales bacterium]|nr:hypothetical protein [Chthoniobacterales bacterium]